MNHEKEQIIFFLPENPNRHAYEYPSVLLTYKWTSITLLQNDGKYASHKHTKVST
jgi:hypothetical protein